MNIGFIGLGAMGAPMAKHLAASGFPVRGYDPFAPVGPESGVTRVDAPTDAAADADVLCVMVATPAQAEAALMGAEGDDANALSALSAGATVVVMATVGPEAATRLAEAVEAVGGRFVDAPVSGGVARAGTGELTIMASGSDEALAAADPVLETLGSSVFRTGPRAGDAQRMKLVNQLLCGVHIAAAGEALAYAEALGIDRAVAFEVVSTGAAASFMLSDRGARMVARDFAQPRSAIDIFVKDLGLVCEAVDLDLPIAEAARSRFALASAAGDGRLDDSAVITTYERPREEQG
jgi:3-hydroxyisobutyrate dehydrogenase-like beta-hydroxyacid dehydrogenase